MLCIQKSNSITSSMEEVSAQQRSKRLSKSLCAKSMKELQYFLFQLGYTISVTSHECDILCAGISRWMTTFILINVEHENVTILYALLVT